MSSSRRKLTLSWMFWARWHGRNGSKRSPHRGTRFMARLSRFVWRPLDIASRSTKLMPPISWTWISNWLSIAKVCQTGRKTFSFSFKSLQRLSLQARYNALQEGNQYFFDETDGKNQLHQQVPMASDGFWPGQWAQRCTSLRQGFVPVVVLEIRRFVCYEMLFCLLAAGIQCAIVFAKLSSFNQMAESLCWQCWLSACSSISNKFREFLGR